MLDRVELNLDGQLDVTFLAAEADEADGVVGDEADDEAEADDDDFEEDAESDNEDEKEA